MKKKGLIMRKKLLIRVNALIAAMVFSLSGLSSCGGGVVMYGVPPDIQDEKTETSEQQEVQAAENASEEPADE